MTTFSQLVDELVEELRRPDLLKEIVTYANQTLRELHFDPETNGAIFYRDNLREAIEVTTRDEGHVWQIPRPATFQALLAAKFLSASSRLGEEVWSTETVPGRHLRDRLWFHYRVGQTYVFSGCGPVNSQIALAWYEFPVSLAYLKPGCRPMYFNEFGGKVYHPDWIHEHSREDANFVTTNWLLERWPMVVSEGIRAKAYKRVSDDSRARMCYSLYAQLRNGLYTSEIANMI